MRCKMAETLGGHPPTRPIRRKAWRPRASALICGFALVVSGLAVAGARADDDDDDKPRANRASSAPTLAGTLVLDQSTGKPAVGSLPVNFVRSPDGRYLIAVNSGYGLQFDARGNRGQQSVMVVDLEARPAPAVVQNVYFPSPQSACVGAVFSPPAPDGSATLYVSGGFENKVWRFRFTPGARTPITPGSPGPATKVAAPSIDLSPLAAVPAAKRYNAGQAAVYPLGLAMESGRLFAANNLGDSLGCVENPDDEHPTLRRVDLRRTPDDAPYPYAVAALPGKVYVSLWNAAAVAVVAWPPAANPAPPVFIPTGSHPNALLADAARHRLFVANANDDSVSVIDTAADREVERISVRLTPDALLGTSPQGLALGPDDTLYVAEARADTVAVIRLGDAARGEPTPAGKTPVPSKLAGLIPTGRYPAAVAVAGRTLFVGNGKGTGTANSSNDADLSGRNPNAPNTAFPPSGEPRRPHAGRGGAYSVALVSGDLLAVPLPGDDALAAHTAEVLRRQGFTARRQPALFAGRKGGSPFKHVIYLIKENRTYDQVFGDLESSGDGTRADGDASLAIFGHGDAARRPDGPAQDVTPNHRALALRFGLLDRFFVNSEASADGHNWSTAAFSSDYVDKVYRWNYSGRGRSYDFEGFNRMPDTGRTGGEPLFTSDLTADTMAEFFRKYLPYTHGGTDAGEPATKYLWDLAAKAGVSYRSYGEFVGTASADDLAAARAGKDKTYPDVSPTLVAVPAKAALEGHFCPAARNFDLNTPDAFTVESYRAARAEDPAKGQDAALTPGNADPRFRGTSRLGAWLEEFDRARADLAAGKGDTLPGLSIVRLSNDHTAGLASGKPSPQFDVADNDYALGRMIEAVSHSPFWKNTAIIAVEDDAQDGPDHVDCHRSVALVISAYNRPGALVHDLHTTASVVRTLEEILGLPPMNAHDAAAAPVDLFRAGAPDLTPYTARLPQLDPDALVNPNVKTARDHETAEAIRRSDAQDLTREDAADPAVLNAAIWLSVRGSRSSSPSPRHLPIYDLLDSSADDDD